MRDLLEQMARASHEVLSAAGPGTDAAWEELDDAQRELFRRSARASLDIVLAALAAPEPDTETAAGSPLAELWSAVDEACRERAPAFDSTGRRRKVGPEDEERGQQAGYLPFNQRND